MAYLYRPKMDGTWDTQIPCNPNGALIVLFFGSFFESSNTVAKLTSNVSL